jgi:outer membrane protein assembly factor BamA
MNKEKNTESRTNLNFSFGVGAYFILFTVILLFAACSGTKRLPDGEKLYTGGEIKLLSNEKVDKKFVKSIANGALRPEPNASYLGMRPQLLIYQFAGTNPRSKLQKWLQKSGDAPVLLSAIKPAVTAAIIDAKLFNIGIFNSYTQYDIVEKKHTAKIIYTSKIHKPFTVKEITYDISDENISGLIVKGKEKSIIKVDEEYNLEILKTERMRIDEILKNNGYFYFNPEYLLFKADTSIVNRTISIRLTLKDSIPAEALRVYRIHSVYINQNYSLNEETPDTTNNTVSRGNISFYGKRGEMNIRPRVILRSIYLKGNAIYSRENHNITLNRLMSMGNFKFVQVKFSESDTTATGYLDVAILMTPMPNKTFRAEMDIVSKSNNYTGPRLNLSTLNRNTFRGAEMLNINMAGSFEAQLSGANQNLFSYSWNPQVELTFPRFITPFEIKQSRSKFIPKTRFSFSYNYLKKVNYFDMSTFQFIYGFKWKNDIRNENEFNPVNISYTSISNESDLFTTLLASNPFLRKSYEEQFISGINLSHTYNEQILIGKKIQYYFNASAETAGNAFSLIKIIGGETPTPDNPSKIAGSIYSQYAKMSFDGRVYYNFRDKNKFAMRLFTGIAKPYGNSNTLPYSKQFFSGGPNSIRAFQINSLGPGIYEQTESNTGFLQLGGEIKLEMNAEYRFNIYSFLKGALFVDAGNVWLQNANPANIGSPFLISNIMNEMAVGTGFGLRIDVSFFILRFDLAMPLRKPWLAENNRWVTNQINFMSPGWRKDNLILNIAIGYPF